MAGPRPDLFRLAGVSLRRDGRPILCDIDWAIGEGERWVVLGPNGSGKTSLLQILSTYLRASDGAVTVLGRPLAGTGVHELRRRMGYLSSALLTLVPDGLTVTQMVDSAQVGAVIPWYLDESGVDRARTARALDAAGLAGLGDRRYGQLSSGEQLRVQLARALVNHPAALLLDEPTANLDIGGREDLIASLSAIATGEIGAMVLVIHRLEDIPPGFTHALLIRGGRVVASGSLTDVLTADNLSRCFATPLDVERVGGRYSAVPSSSQSIASR